MCNDNIRLQRRAGLIFDMEVWCRETNKQVILTLESTSPQKGSVAQGKPIICNDEIGCTKRKGVECFLNCELLEGRRH